MMLKADKWWVFKIAGGLLTVVLLTALAGIDVNAAYWWALGKLFGAFILLAIYGHLVNDISDLEIDAKAGKSNIVNTLGKGGSIIGILLTGILAIVLATSIGSVWVAVMVVIQISLNAIYSLKPIRLKERGVVSVLVTGFYERSLPYAMIGATLLETSDRQLSVFMVYLAWSYVWEIRNHLNGQIADLEADAMHGVRSLASLHGVEKLQAWMWRLFLMELLLFCSWVFQFGHSLEVLIFAFLLAWYFHKRRTGNWTIVRLDSFDISDDIYNFCLPVLFAGSFTIFENRDLWPLALILLIGFDNYLRKLVFVVLDKIRWKVVGSDLMWHVRNRFGK